MTTASRTRPQTEEEMKEFVQSGNVIESPAQMTERYKDILTNYILIQVDNELVTHYSYAQAWDSVPSDRARLALFSVLKDEMAHCHTSFRVLGDMGYDVEELIYGREPHEFRNNFGVAFPARHFADVAVSIGLIDRAGGLVLEDMHENCSYKPYARSLKRICADQRFHQKYGFTMMKRMVNHSPEVKAKVQESVDYYFHAALEWFGTPDEHSIPTEHFEYRIKDMTSDEYRQQWLQEVVPFLTSIDIDVPAHETDSGEIVLDFDFPVAYDWDEHKFHYDEPVSWDQVFDRWKQGGPIWDELGDELELGGPRAVDPSTAAD